MNYRLSYDRDNYKIQSIGETDQECGYYSSYNCKTKKIDDIIIKPTKEQCIKEYKRDLSKEFDKRQKAVKMISSCLNKANDPHE